MPNKTDASQVKPEQLPGQGSTFLVWQSFGDSVAVYSGGDGIYHIRRSWRFEFTILFLFIAFGVCPLIVFACDVMGWNAVIGEFENPEFSRPALAILGTVITVGYVLYLMTWRWITVDEPNALLILHQRGPRPRRWSIPAADIENVRLRETHIVERGDRWFDVPKGGSPPTDTRGTNWSLSIELQDGRSTVLFSTTKEPVAREVVGLLERLKADDL